MPIRITPAVKALLIACFAVFLVQQTADQFFHGHVLAWLGLIPGAFIIEHRLWQLFTYSFVHSDVLQLVLNLMMLAFIGGELEDKWGTWRFVLYFFICSTSAGVLYLLLHLFFWNGAGAPMIGATAGIYGLLVAYGLIFGERTMLFMMLFPMKAKHFVWVLIGIEFFSTVFSGRGGGISSAAHLGGMAAGFAYLWGAAAWAIFQRRRAEGAAMRPARAGRTKKSRNSHLKLVISNQFESDEKDDKEGPKTWH